MNCSSRIDARFDAMMAAGALEEVRALAARGLDPNLPAMKAHGVPWLVRTLKGEIALAEAVEGGKRDTRHYTKRQATWFRNQLAGVRMGRAASVQTGGGRGAVACSVEPERALINARTTRSLDRFGR